MESTNLRPAAIILTIGSILFLVAAFLPVSKVYMEQDPNQKLIIINQMKMAWTIEQVLFGIGSLVSVLALALISFGMKQAPNSFYAIIGVGLMAIGAILWSWHVTERIISPEGFIHGNSTAHLFLIYTVLTQIGLVLLGLFFLNSEVKNWLGWMFIIAPVAFFVLMIIFKDMPPFVYYVLTLIFAIVLLFDVR